MTRIKAFIRHNLTPYLSIVLIQLPILSIIYTWEPDQHHDGVMFAAAVAVSDGYLPNRDVFAQYGPITPWIQGLWLHITSSTVLNMRILTVLFILGISLLMFHLLKRLVSTEIALLANFAWVLTGPFGLPWSSLITTFLALLIILVVSLALNQRKSTARNILLSVSGFIVVMGTFTRIHFFLIGLAVTIFLRLGAKSSIKFGLNFFEISAFCSFLAFFILFQNLQMLKPYLEQCIIWAFGSYSTAPEFSKSLVIDFLWIPTIAVIVMGLIFWIGKSKGTKILWINSLVVSLIYSLVLFGSRLPRTGHQTLRNPKILLIDASQKMLFGIGYTSIIWLILVSLFYAKNTRLYQRKYPLEFWIAVASLFQLYPFFDPHHVWFITPLLLIALISISSQSGTKFKNIITRGARPVLLIVILALFVQFGVSATQDRYKYTSPQMRGMESIWRSADEIDKTLIKLNKYALPNSVHFECKDGLFAVANGRYLANSSMFVTWGPNSQSTSQAKQLFACYLDRGQIQSYLDEGYSIVFKTDWQPLTYPNDRKYWNVLFATP